jgi:hypothetical protein
MPLDATCLLVRAVLGQAMLTAIADCHWYSNYAVAAVLAAISACCVSPDQPALPAPGLVCFTGAAMTWTRSCSGAITRGQTHTGRTAITVGHSNTGMYDLAPS